MMVSRDSVNGAATTEDRSRLQEPASRHDGTHPEVEALSLPTGALDVLLAGCTDAILIVDDQNVVRRLNPLASELLPEVLPGARLDECAVPALREALTEERRDFCAAHRDHELLGRSVTLAAGLTAWYVRDVTSERDRENALLAERRRKSFLAHASAALAGTLSPGRVLSLAARLPVGRIAGHCAAAMSDGAAAMVATASQDGVTFRRTRRSAVLRRLSAVADPTAEPLGDHAGTPGEHDQELLAELLPEVPSARSLPAACDDPDDEIMLLPLTAGTDVHGVLALTASPGMSRHDRILLRDYAQRVSTALEAARVHAERSRIAESLRSALLPPALPEPPGLSLGSAYRASAEATRIGGDFLDVHEEPEGGRWTFSLGDVCGKGVDAAVLTGQVRQSLRTASLVSAGPAARLELLNRVMLQAGDGRFATVVTGAVTTIEGGGARIRLANGGHPRPLVLRQNGDVESLETAGMLVGALAEASFLETETHLAPGESLLLYTDGVTEARDESGEMFEEERLQEELARCGGLPARAVADRVQQRVFEFLHGNDHDDIAILVIQAEPTSPPEGIDEDTAGHPPE
ncbi:PP2C family protein-serine/threonine phosphatase [Actinoalloteichus spitiensis]|uniref:PP2C family protein-serine/threonine phosphatase n=1 Tax=Actinoalloteichus spitiensis TaxID=252394 RepID=UPI0012F677C4|nr:PP2C family protein-serine/threonine phosphatase [Actinoalloteichus spitiensis]